MIRDEGSLLMVFLLGAVTKVAHTKITYMRALFNSHLESVNAYTEEGNVKEAENFKDFTIRDLEMVDNYAWGSAALIHLHKGLNVATTSDVRIIYHFLGLCGRVETTGYTGVQPT
ncbi:hypothetical protein TSUD_23570 [Trifolium subterraneum]|uniref:Aminotransferase-like plant mobile domain-containing protein n=1 Tax=Trifolium subterraneum TaxID=3900 RepID=A0A2Z6ML33_TRISU|nr:hypothetical protein TSUD_23570 [Trifolium subterraneum]